MEIERVQKWVRSALLLTVATIFAGGLCFMAGYVDRPGAQPGLLTNAVVVGVAAMGGVRIINHKPMATPLAAARAAPCRGRVVLPLPALRIRAAAARRHGS